MKNKIIIILGLFLINNQVFSQDSILNSKKEIEYKKEVFKENYGIANGGRSSTVVYQWRYVGSDSWTMVQAYYKNMQEPLGLFPESALLIKQARNYQLAKTCIVAPVYMGGFFLGVLSYLKYDDLIDEQPWEQDASKIRNLKIASYTGIGIFASGLITYFIFDKIGTKKFIKAIDTHNENVTKETSSLYNFKLGLTSNSMSYYPALSLKFSM